jgi:hypothetical protein
MQYVLATLLFLPLLASANDGIGSVSAGGIVFRNTDAIAMKKEVLTVGYQIITVDYEFLNESGADVEETIIFPLPAYPAAEQGSETYYGQPNGFSIQVDGRPVKFRTVVRALMGEADVTEQLRKAGLTDAQIAAQPGFPNVKVKPVSKQQWQQLGKDGLLTDGWQGNAVPAWDIQVNYVWQQTFPANKVVRVHHAYRPFVGAGPGESGMDKDTIQRYCADAAFLKSWKRQADGANEQNDGYLSAAKVSYILKTGNSWKNGIEDFTLNLVKSDPADLISLCFPGKVNKIDAKTYQVRLKNFRPTKNLEVYFGGKDLNLDNEGKMPILNK